MKSYNEVWGMKLEYYSKIEELTEQLEVVIKKAREEKLTLNDFLKISKDLEIKLDELYAKVEIIEVILNG